MRFPSSIKIIIAISALFLLFETSVFAATEDLIEARTQQNWNQLWMRIIGNGVHNASPSPALQDEIKRSSRLLLYRQWLQITDSYQNSHNAKLTLFDAEYPASFIRFLQNATTKLRETSQANPAELELQLKVIRNLFLPSEGNTVSDLMSPSTRQVEWAQQNIRTAIQGLRDEISSSSRVFQTHSGQEVESIHATMASDRMISPSTLGVVNLRRLNPADDLILRGELSSPSEGPSLGGLHQTYALEGASARLSSMSLNTRPTLSYLGARGRTRRVGALMIVRPHILRPNGAAITDCRIKSGSENEGLFPSALSINASTCVISGIPTTTLPTTTFTLVATNRFGTSRDALVSLTIVDAPLLSDFVPPFLPPYEVHPRPVPVLPEAVALDPEVTALHLAEIEWAQEKRKASPPMPYRTRTGAQGVFIAEKDFQEAQSALSKAQIKISSSDYISGYIVNAAFLSADPYLKKHRTDINQLYPDSISNEEWNKLIELLKCTPHVQKSDLDRVLIEIMEEASETAQQALRKRIKRLIENAQQKEVKQREKFLLADPSLCPRKSTVFSLEHLAVQLSSAIERCPDGLSKYLYKLERYLGEGNPQNLGDFVSRVLTRYKSDFVESYKKISANDEVKTTLPLVLRSRMHSALGLPGEREVVTYPGQADPLVSEFQPQAVMKHFLTGGDVTYQGTTIHHDPYDVRKMVDLLQESYRLGQTKEGPKSGKPVLTGKSLTSLVRKDPELGNVYEAFISDFGKNPYFKFSKGEIQLKDAFWLYVLEKYGYIVRQPHL